MATRDTEAPVLGLELPDGLTEDEWAEEGQRLGHEAARTAWQIGDWLRYAEEHFGDGRYGRAGAVTGLDYGTLRNYASVAGRFDVSRRRDALSFGHHAVVASLPEQKQESLLNRAEQKDLPVQALREIVSKARSGERVRSPRYTVKPTPDMDAHWATAATKVGKSVEDWLIEIANHEAGVGKTDDSGEEGA